MSDFDKRVCNWLSSSIIDREIKQQILENVKISIDEYKKVKGASNSDQTQKRSEQRSLQTRYSQVKDLDSPKAIDVPNKSKEDRQGKCLKKNIVGGKVQRPTHYGVFSINIDFEFVEEIDREISLLEPVEQEDTQSPIPSSRRTASIPEEDNHTLSPHENGTRASRRSLAQRCDNDANTSHPDSLRNDASKNICTIVNGHCAQVDDVIEDQETENQESEDHLAFDTYRFGDSEDCVDNENDSELGNSSKKSYDSKEETIEDTEDQRRRDMTMRDTSRQGVSCLSLCEEELMSVEFPTTPKSRDVTKFIVNLLESHYLFSFIENEYLEKLAMVMEATSVSEGSQLFVKGETGSTFYVIIKGTADMTFEDRDGNVQTTKLESGAVVGDFALLYPGSSAVTVVATSPLECATLERDTYKKFVSCVSEAKRRRYVSFLEGVPFLAVLTPQERLRIAEALKEDEYKEGETIIKYGTTIEWLHIIVEGTADVIGRDENGLNMYVVTFKEGDCAGDLELLYNHKTVADIVASSPVVKTAKLGCHHFKRLIGSAKELLERKAEEDESYQYYRSSKNNVTPQQEISKSPSDELSECPVNAEEQPEI